MESKSYSPHNQKVKVSAKKFKKITAKLVNDGLNISDAPTNYVAVANGGLGNGVSVKQLSTILKDLDVNASIQSYHDKAYACVKFDDVQSAQVASDNLHGRVIEKNLEVDKQATLSTVFIKDIPSFSKLPSSTDDNDLPSGLIIYNDFLSVKEERVLMEHIEDDFSQSSSKFVKEKLKNRSVLHYGYKFRYGSNDVDLSAPLSNLPDYVDQIVDRMMKAQYFKTKPDQLTINKYEPGDGIPNHIDNTVAFEEVLATVSLGASTVMEMSCGDQTRAFTVVPRTLMLFTGDSRYKWTHGIRPKKVDVVVSEENLPVAVKRDTRISLTFRKVVDQRFSDLKLPCCENEAKHIEKDYVQAVYNDIANHFSSTREKPWPRVVEFLNGLEPHSLVLDIGCGSGRYLSVKTGNLVIGCDFSVSLVNICHAKGCNAFVCDGLDVPVKSLSFDACTCIAMLHHLTTVERRAACLKELLRVVRPNGKVMVYVWAAEQKLNNKPSNYLKKQATDISATQESQMCSQDGKIGIHQNRTDFAQQDLLVPWKLKGQCTKSCSDKPPKESGSSSTYFRFYHVFKQSELEELCTSVGQCKVIDSYYDNGNWAVILQKESFG